ncbi:DNA-directed RNA polymerase III subunit RPC4 [Metschnikowia aff. pulcherrima]|uniref:DNA-directed RNA polymerase III subunit RPC4 n=1 Tax=Metschnikowia aff. pulcherrima TaxID=2163413 RepID=A0A4P6XK39_9ASCO|nr:DNA-directed RNA polymerase III subunit RPC4 [Metschnikowia aff. pulcherrima]
MSQRLELLNPKKTAAKPGLKFKPKAVARKSEKDRAKEAPEVKSEDRFRNPNATRGRGLGRGRGRGRGGAYVGTHVVSAGPLAMGSVGVGGGMTSLKTGLTSDRIYGAGDSASVAPLANLKLKLRDGVKKLEEDSDSDGDDPTKINMNKEYAFDETETVLFPVRPQKAVATVLEPQLVLDTSTLPLLSATPGLRDESVMSVNSVKTEDFNGVKPEFEPSFTPPVLVNPDEKQESDEHDRILDDQRLIVDLITLGLDSMKTDDDTADDDKYVLLHVPQITPKPTETENDEIVEPSATKHEKIDVSKLHYASSNAQNFEGQVGSLNFHQLGKITMSFGDSVFQCAGGNPLSFLQELYIIEDSSVEAKPEEEDASVLDADGNKILGRIYRLGDISGKIVATPAIQ